MKVFITGATGFIGRRLTDKLLERGCEITALVRTINHGLDKRVKTLIGDITIAESYKNALHGTEILYHLAAAINFLPSKRDELIKTNAYAVKDLLENAAKAGINKSVVLSSACTIGISDSKNKILDESEPLNEHLVKTNPYMESKVMCEKFAIEASKILKVIIVNPTTVYGAGDKTLNSGALISKVMNSAIIPVPSGGSNVVDVEDVADGIIAAGDKGKSGKRYILSGYNLLYRDVVSAISEVSGRKPVFINIPEYMCAPMAMAADLFGKITGNRFMTKQIIGDMFNYKFFSNELACKELLWKPKVSFKKSVEKAIKYYKENNIL